MKWSTPTRMARQKALSVIPNEVYLEIFDYVTDSVNITAKERHRMLSNLALVCHFFCAVAVPRIFRSICIAGTATKPDGSATNSAKFCSAIARGKEPAASLASHVRECAFLSWKISRDLPWVASGFMGMYGRALRRMSNLQSLHMDDVDLDKHFMKVICGVKTLTSLTLSLSSIVTDVTEVQKISPFPLKEFIFVWTSRTPLSDRHANLISRVVDVRCLESLSSSTWAVAKGILSQSQESILEKLVLYEADSSPVLWNALKRCKSLKTLRILRLNVSEDPIPVLPASSIPNLQQLSCPPTMLSLVQGRPLSTVELSGYQFNNRTGTSMPLMTLSDISLLKQSSVEILVLRVPSHLLFLAPLSQKFPSVRELHIDCKHLNYDSDNVTTGAGLKKFVNKIRTHWNPAYSVRSLRFSPTALVFLPKELDYSVNLELQRCLLPELLVPFPNLRYAQFVEMVEWSREVDSDSWIGCIPSHYHLQVRSMLQEAYMQTEIKDINGIFARLLEA